MIHRFYLSVECPECDEEFVDGPHGTTITKSDLPVIPYDIAAQQAFACPHCDAQLFTGDFDILTEGEL
jgi:hypothetical protein